MFGQDQLLHAGSICGLSICDAINPLDSIEAYLGEKMQVEFQAAIHSASYIKTGLIHFEKQR